MKSFFEKSISAFNNLLFSLKITETASIIIFSLIVGMASGFGAIIFRWLIDVLKIFFFTGGRELLSFLGRYYVILIPMVGGLIVGPLVYFFAKEAKGHGVPEVMEAVALKGGRIRPRVSFVKAIASSVCIGSGGSVGREGPIVQIGSALGSTIGQIFKMSDARIRNLVACGAAGGIAATFNAPIAGVFFALEVILGEFTGWAFSAVVLSSVTASIISRAFLGNQPAFIVPPYALKSPWEMPFYFLLGILAAFAAIVFTRILYSFEDLFDRIKIPEYLKPALGGIFIGSIGLFFPQIFGVGYNAIESALSGQIVLPILLALILIKILATSLTIGSGGSGGIFAPSLFIGAMLGGAFGYVVHLIQPGIAATSGAYALVGMAAVFAAAASAPITAILILFEMTGDYFIILPLMFACVTSTITAKGFSKENIYTLKLLRRGIRIRQGKDQNIMDSIKAEQAMIKEVITAGEHMIIKEVFDMIRNTKHRGFPVINPAGELSGMITYQDIRKAIDEGKENSKVSEFCTKDLIVCYTEESLNDALKKMGLRNVGRLPVVSRENPKKIVGLITRKNIISTYNQELLRRERKYIKP